MKLKELLLGGKKQAVNLKIYIAPLSFLPAHYTKSKPKTTTTSVHNSLCQLLGDSPGLSCRGSCLWSLGGS